MLYVYPLCPIQSQSPSSSDPSSSGSFESGRSCVNNWIKSGLDCHLSWVGRLPHLPSQSPVGELQSMRAFLSLYSALSEYNAESISVRFSAESLSRYRLYCSEGREHLPQGLVHSIQSGCPLLTSAASFLMLTITL